MKPGNVATSKAKDFKGTLRRLVKYLRPYRNQLILIIVAAILSTIFAISAPKIMGRITTLLFEGMMEKMNGVPGGGVDLITIGKILAVLGVIYVFSSLFSYVQQYIMAGVAQKAVFDLRRDVDSKLATLPLKYFDSNTNGEILSRITNDIDNISNTLQQSATQLITSVVTIIGVTIMMITISPLLTVIVVLTLPIAILIIKPITTRSQSYFINQQVVIGSLNGHVEEMYTGHNVIKAFSREDESIEKFSEINERLYEVGYKAQFISGAIMPIMRFVNNLGYVLMSVVGGILVTQGTITVGDVQAFIQYSQQFSQPINQTANIINIIQSAVASAERVFEVLDEEEQVHEIVNPITIDKPKGQVEFEHVKFGYKPNELLMTDVNIHVESGQKVAIVGPTGAGKTTLINLLLRFYELNGGEISIDDVNIANMRRGDLRRLFGMVLQDTWLFKGTIKENLAYGKEGATDEEIVNAAKLASADYFIRTLPHGYDTEINEEASNVSQGQRQLLTIARAILANPTILILDEATSSVDTRTEAQIQQGMKNMMKGRTSFVIAHRLSTIKDADLILYMQKGNVLEKGNHEELMKKNGYYAQLYNSQFAKNDEDAV